MKKKKTSDVSHHKTYGGGEGNKNICKSGLAFCIKGALYKIVSKCSL